MATYNKFDCFVGDLGLGKHNLNNDALFVYLSNATPSNNGDSIKTDLAEITAENGYNAEDIQNNYAQTAGVGELKGVTVQWTANGGAFGPFRYNVLFNNTEANDALIGWWDYGSSISCNNGESFTWQTPANNLIANFA